MNTTISTSPRVGRGQAWPRLLALAEVVLIFAAVHVGWRAFKHFTALGKMEGAAGLNYSPGAIMIAVSVALIAARGGAFRESGFVLGDWRYFIKLGLVWGAAWAVVGGLVVVLLHYRPPFRPSPPKSLSQIGAVGEALFAVLLLLMLRYKRPERPSPWRVIVRVAILAILLSLPVVLAAYRHRSTLKAVETVGWLCLGAGLGEEVFFRGYVQSRLNGVFGTPLRFLGMDFGVGLFVSSVLFGLVHALNPVDYFHGHLAIDWWWGLANVGSGLFFGCMRQRTGSLLPGVIAHALGDVLAEVPGYLAAF